MVFWGIVVKPGAPFTLLGNRRLHLSQATLGVGSATTKSIVRCNVGDKTPVFLCTLVPEKMESCPLNLKYEEAVKVVFSVIGSLSVHLTGYFEENSTNVPNNDDDDKTESFGEDIPDTETERSDSDDDDEYGGSFINDADIEVFPTSPSIEVGKTSVRKKCRKLKKCSIVESDDDDCSPVTATSKLQLPSAEVDETSSKKEGGKSMNGHIVESANDDRSPVTAPRRALSNAEVDETSSKKEGGKSMNGHIVESANDDRSPVTAPRHALPNAEVDETSSKKDDTELMKCHISEPNNDSCPPVNATTQLFGIFDVSDSEEDDTSPIGTRLRHKSAFRSLNFDSVHVERETVNSKNNLTENELGTLTLSPENDLAALKPERDAGMESDFGSEHKEEQSRELKSSNSVNNLPLLDQNSVDNGDSPVPKLDVKTDDVDAGKSLEGIVDNNGVRIDHKCHHPEQAKEILENSIDDSGQEKQRKKKKRKTAEDCCTDVISEVDKALKNGKLDSDDQQKGRKRKKRKDFNIKDVDKSKTLANGLFFEEQEIGNPDGKIATMGKRVSIHYVVKSLESGQVLSNPDQAPLKFKLGSEGHDGWELGIEGMRVGGKRRIHVPPSLGLSTEGAEVSLVYEVELVNVR